MNNGSACDESRFPAELFLAMPAPMGCALRAVLFRSFKALINYDHNNKMLQRVLAQKANSDAKAGVFCKKARQTRKNNQKQS